MIPLPIAQAASLAGTVGWYAIAAVVIIGIIAIVLVVARAAGIAIPSWVVQLLWILAAVVAAVLAIKIILSLI